MQSTCPSPSLVPGDDGRACCPSAAQRHLPCLAVREKPAPFSSRSFPSSANHPPLSTVIVYSAPPSPLNSAPTPVNCNHGLHPARRNLSLDGQQRTTDATRPYPPVEVAALPAPCSVTLVTAGALSELNFTETRPGTSNRWRKFPSRSWLARGLLRLFPSPFRLPWYADVSANLSRQWCDSGGYHFFGHQFLLPPLDV